MEPSTSQPDELALEGPSDLQAIARAVRILAEIIPQRIAREGYAYVAITSRGHLDDIVGTLEMLDALQRGRALAPA